MKASDLEIYLLKYEIRVILLQYFLELAAYLGINAELNLLSQCEQQ
tara:strand:+ start:17575 stop:17712 length:138 start_codon:yes stop_codon:yes gene_type:complete